VPPEVVAMEDPAVPVDGTIPTEDELCALALAADPDAPLAPDAVPIAEVTGGAAALLPSWYMPGPFVGGRASRWRSVVVLGLVATFVVIEALGLCSTFGQLLP
jgi:hypothetical protein